MGNFWKIPKEFGRCRNLTCSAKIVYGYLLDRQGDNGHSWPGLRRIASDCGINRETAANAINQLEKSGWMGVKRVKGNPSHRTNNYFVRLENPAGRNIQTAGKSELQRPENPARFRLIEPDPIEIYLKDKIEHIYQTYPRHVGHDKATASIRSAIKKIQSTRKVSEKDAADWLAGVVVRYAKTKATCSADERKFIPYPATWFNRGSYNDDEREWSGGHETHGDWLRRQAAEPSSAGGELFGDRLENNGSVGQRA